MLAVHSHAQYTNITAPQDPGLGRTIDICPKKVRASGVSLSINNATFEAPIATTFRK